MRETSEPLAKRRRVESKKGAKSFTHFPLLPTELRHLVYSKVTLFDRVVAVKSSPDAAEYFGRNRVKSCMKMSVAKKKKNVYVKVEYHRSGYCEMHKVPDALKDNVLRDILSSVGCRCEFCDDGFAQYTDEPGKRVQSRYYDNGANFADAVFGPLNSVVELNDYLDIKSAPVGGLVDLLQPSGKVFHREPVLFWAWWHQLRGSYYIRNDPKINVQNWAKWIDYTESNEITINNNREYEGPLGYLHQDFFDLSAFQQAAKVLLTECNVDISDKQLASMRAHQIHIKCDLGSNRLTELGLLEFYKTKIKEWLLVPETTFKFIIKLQYNMASAALYMNSDRLLEDVREELKSPDFLIDPEFHLRWREQRSHLESCLLIEHVKSKKALEINNEGLCTVNDPRADYVSSAHFYDILRGIHRNRAVEEDDDSTDDEEEYLEQDSEEELEDDIEEEEEEEYYDEFTDDDYSNEDDQDGQDQQGDH